MIGVVTAEDDDTAWKRVTGDMSLMETIDSSVFESMLSPTILITAIKVTKYMMVGQHLILHLGM